jgi:hemin uptake protein HemP
MKQAEETHFTFCTDIFQGKYLDIEGKGKVEIRIDYPENDPEHKITVEMTHNNEKILLHTLFPGDTYTLNHKVGITATKNIKKDHAFPIVFKMDGQEYKLNRTKQNKLILTK